MVVRHRLRAADLRRGVLVCLERRIQAVLRRAPGLVCPRGRSRTGSHHRARARQRRLAHRTEPGRAGGPPARLLAPVLPRASARRAPLAHSGGAAREPLLCDPRRSGTHGRRPLPGPRRRSAQPRDKLPLVAQASQPELISRRWYDATRAPRSVTLTSRIVEGLSASAASALTGFYQDTGLQQGL